MTSTVREQADDFAEGLARSIRALNPTAPRFLAVVSEKRGLLRFEIEPVDTKRVPITVNRTHIFDVAMVQATTSGRRSVRNRAAREATPKMAEVHIPMGGPRLRPALEDVLEMLIHDFGADCVPDALQVLAAHRHQWRLSQARSIVSSLPEEAADVLRDLGYSVIAPTTPANSREAWLDSS